VEKLETLQPYVGEVKWLQTKAAAELDACVAATLDCAFKGKL
jgi:hypothetical protein